MTKKRYARILRGCGFDEPAIRLSITLALSTKTPYADAISECAVPLICYYRCRDLSTPLPRELRRYEEAWAWITSYIMPAVQ